MDPTSINQKLVGLLGAASAQSVLDLLESELRLMTESVQRLQVETDALRLENTTLKTKHQQLAAELQRIRSSPAAATPANPKLPAPAMEVLEILNDSGVTPFDALASLAGLTHGDLRYWINALEHLGLAVSPKLRWRGEPGSYAITPEGRAVVAAKRSGS